MPRRFRRLLAAAGLLTIAAGSAAIASSSVDTYTELCGRWQNTPVQHNRYMVSNNVWGATSPQCIDVGSDGGFQVTKSGHHSVDSAAAYPSIYTGCHWGICTRGTSLPLRVNEVKSVRSNWRAATGAPGVWTATYDLWFHTSVDINRSPDGAEIMIWLDHSAGANPNGKVVARNVRLAGSLWDVWYGDLAWNYVAYVRTSRTTSVRNLDLKAFTTDAVHRGYIKPSWYLSGVEAGFEIWRDGTGLTSQAFSVMVARGPAVPAVTRPVEPPCSVRWNVSSWDTGLTVDVDVINHGPPLDGWRVEWEFTDDETINTDWGAEISQTRRQVIADSVPYNSTIGTNASTTFGFQAAHTGTQRRPDNIRLNGSRCALE